MPEETDPKIYAKPMSESIGPLFSFFFLILFYFLTFRSFRVLGLTFKPLIHFEFYLCIWCEKVVQFDSFAYSCPIFPMSFIEEAVFPHSCLLCHGLIDHISMDHKGYMLRGASYAGCVSPPIVNDYCGHAGRQGSPWPGWLPDPTLCGGCWPLEGGSQSLGKGWDCQVGPWLVPACWWVGLGYCRNSCLEKEMATHSSVLAWRIPGMGEPGGLLSMGSHRVVHN